MCTAAGCDASFDYERTIVMDFWPKIVKKRFSLFFVHTSWNFLSDCPNNKTKLGFVIPTRLSGEAVDCLPGYGWSLIGGLIGAVKAMLTVVSSDANFDREGIFLMGLSPKTLKKKILYPFSTLPKTFHPVANKNILDFAMPTGLLGELV